MAIYSFVPHGLTFEKVEIECVLVPGPPGLQILGCPDTLVKESSWRVPAALISSGYELPLTEKILINLKPHSIKKNWSQIEFAMAIAVLQATSQARHLPQNLIAVGSLGLSGSVETQMSDIKLLPVRSNEILYLSDSAETEARTVVVKHLSELRAQLDLKESMATKPVYIAPEGSSLKVSGEWAKWILWMSVGKLNTLLAGTPGTGKSTFAHQLWSIHSPDSDEQFKQSQMFHRRLNKELKWSPFIQPHHSTTALAFIGGGQPIRPGAVTLAHSGVLLMDEYLEFKPEVQESLREPLENKSVHLLRGSDYQVLPADFLLIATTNLCPCGNWIPQPYRNPLARCKCSQSRLSKYQHRLRGPVLDRFDLLIYFNQKPVPGTLAVSELLEHRKEIMEFKKSIREMSWSEESSEFLRHQNLSMRRQRAVRRAAESAAYVDFKNTVLLSHVKEVLPYTVRSFDAWLS